MGLFGGTNSGKCQQKLLAKQGKKKEKTIRNLGRPILTT